MQICPYCRHTYHDHLHATCPSCYQDETVSSEHHLSASNDADVLVNLYDFAMSKQEHYRWRQLLCGGSVIFHNDDLKFDDSKTEKDASAKQQSNEVGDNSVLSPTTSLSFILSPMPSAFGSLKPGDQTRGCDLFNSEEDLLRIAESQRLLKLSGWYHRGLSWKEAIDLLMPTLVGTFLLRDSSDSNYLYSLSVQTKCGPTSLRIHYSNGDFRLDADQPVAHQLPKYPCIIKLIQKYIESTRNKPLECSHENDEASMKQRSPIYSEIVLTKPLNTKENFPSLKHLSRLCVNKHLLDPSFRDVLAAPSYVIAYLNEYPFHF